MASMVSAPDIHCSLLPFPGSSVPAWLRGCSDHQMPPSHLALGGHQLFSFPKPQLLWEVPLGWPGREPTLVGALFPWLSAPMDTGWDGCASELGVWVMCMGTLEKLCARHNGEGPKALALGVTQGGSRSGFRSQFSHHARCLKEKPDFSLPAGGLGPMGRGYRGQFRLSSRVLTLRGLLPGIP